MKLYQFWNYDLAEVAETWIDELLEQEEWFSYTLPEVAGNSGYRAAESAIKRIILYNIRIPGISFSEKVV